MKTKPMSHQVDGIKHLYDRLSFAAMGAEQGTGKTWMLLADAERRWLEGDITGLLVIAPKGVHTNWLRKEIPEHFAQPVKAFGWSASMPKFKQAQFEDLLKRDGSMELIVFAMNYDAVNTKTGFEAAKRFLERHRTMLVLDESHKIKNPDSKRTQKISLLGERAASRRIASGTIIADKPLDVFAQFQFLEHGILGTNSYRNFVATYAVLEGPLSDAMFAARQRSPQGTHAQIVARDDDGNQMFKNLDRLTAKMKPHTFRVTKAQCLDLPPKIYQRAYFEMEPEQRAMYDSVAANMRYEVDGRLIDDYTALTLIGKLRQLTSGFVLVDGQPHDLRYGQARISTTVELISEHPNQVIVWATHREEIYQLEKALEHFGCVSYHGETKPTERQHAIDEFQAGRVKVFIGNPVAGGTGLTLTAADMAIYHSCSFSMVDRLQSEDRCHRIGTKRPVLYVDVVAEDSIDERIASALQAKQGNAAAVMRHL